MGGGTQLVKDTPHQYKNILPTPTPNITWKCMCRTKFWEIRASKSPNPQVYWILEMKFHPYQHNSIYRTYPYQHIKNIFYSPHQEKNIKNWHSPFSCKFKWSSPNSFSDKKKRTNFISQGIFLKVILFKWKNKIKS